jgi:cytochrome c peroxidase
MIGIKGYRKEPKQIRGWLFKRSIYLYQHIQKKGKEEMKRILLGICIVLMIVFFENYQVIAKQPKVELSSLEKLGQLLYNDKALSLNENQSCQTCHHPSAKFADPDNIKEPVLLPVSKGSDPNLFGGRNAPTAAYAKFSPPLHWDGELFIGGLFWDGRASGNKVTDTAVLGGGPTFDPLADQAKGPFQNPVEMALWSDEEVVRRVLTSNYAARFLAEYEKHGNEMSYYNFISIAIAAFEKSHELNKFSSKFDAFLAEQGGDVSDFGVEEVEIDDMTFRMYVGPPKKFKSKYYSYEEADGLAIFNADSYQQLGIEPNGINGGMCYLCHLTTNHDEDTPPIFTDSSYDNLGIPVNHNIEKLAGPQPIDYGLGAQTFILDGAKDSPSNNWETEPYCKNVECKATVDVYPKEIGKFRVSTLRNIAKTAPYGHNGFFENLEQIVQFYNDRTEVVLPPEVAETVNNEELGNLGLRSDQQKKIILFLKTLTDE